MLARKITYNTFVSAGARIVGLALSLVTVGFITRYLGQAGFGYYATILAFLYFFTVLSDLGLYNICLREISRPGADEVKITNNAFTLRFFAGFFIFALAPLTAYFFPYPGQVKLGILLAFLGYWLSDNSQLLMAVFQKYLRMDKVALAELVGRLFQLGLVVFFVKNDFGFLALVSALVVNYAVYFMLIFAFSRRYVKVRFDFDFVFWRQLLKKSLPLGLAAVFTMFSFRLDALMLSLLKPPADMGIYNLAYRFLESLMFFPAMFVGLFMPFLSRFALSSKKEFRRTSRKALDVLLIFVIPLMLGIFFFSQDIVVLVAGPAFILSAGVLNILAIAIGIKFLEILFAKMFIALEKQKQLLFIHGSGALLNLLTNLIFIPIYSYYGAAATTVLTGLFELSLMVLLLRRSFKEYLPASQIAVKTILAGLVMALALYLAAGWPLLILIVAAALVYFLALFLLGGFSAREILALVRKET